MSCASKAPLIALAFKLEQGPFGQLTCAQQTPRAAAQLFFTDNRLSDTCAFTKERSDEAIL